MTKTGIINLFGKYGIDLENDLTNGKSEWYKLDKAIFYMSFSDAMKTKKMDKNSEYQFDMTNEIIIQRRTVTLKNGNTKIICYPGTETPCYNVFSFDSLLNVAKI